MKFQPSDPPLLFTHTPMSRQMEEFLRDEEKITGRDRYVAEGRPARNEPLVAVQWLCGWNTE